MTQFRRVVVTGIGAISSLGVGVDAMWSSLVAGDSGLQRITRFETEGFATTFAGEVGSFHPTTRDRFVEFALIAAGEAIATASVDAHNATVLMGTAFGGIESLESGQFDKAFPWGAPDAIVETIGATGPALTYQASFAGSANAIGEGFERIRQGRADIVIAGGSEAAITPTVVAGFIAMGATSHSTGDPTLAVKPFAGDRDGCAIGEGSAVLVLEEREAADRRGAEVLAEIVGYGTTADAVHVVALPDDGDGIVRAMRLALDQAGMRPWQLGYINAHGTGTTMNDAVETGAMKRILGSDAKRIPISSTKPATGHLLGAAGALEAIISIQSLRTGIVPPTLNLRVPDPLCDLDYVPLVSRRVDPEVAMSNSMGFGGHAVCLIFQRD